MAITRSQSSSARILVGVKRTTEIRPILKLLFSRVVQSEDYILFLHVAAEESVLNFSDLRSLDEAVCEASYSLENPTPKVLISSAVVKGPDVCDGIVCEAKKLKATMVIFGSSRVQFISRSMHRLGKHCVKALPSYCSILTVQRGKVMQARTGCAATSNTLKALLWKQRKLEQVEKKAKVSESVVLLETASQASSSCSMDTVLSFSTEGTFCSMTPASSEIGSPDTVLYYQPHEEQKALSKLSSSSTEIDTLKRFDYEELLLATRNFAPDSLIGHGGCCSVYKGILHSGTTVAVKRLRDSSSGEREFTREIKVISYIHHPNLISLVGFCSDESQRLLVYEFVQNGSLQEHLHGTGRSLSWKLRQTIAVGTARGLEHLHRLSPHHVIHQDVKSSNILLATDFQPQISDFGFARWSNELTLTCSGLVGTFGYMAPEYLVHGIASEKTDVYSFGVVLLELISGRPSIDSTLPTKQQSLVHWASVLQKTGATYQMVDPNLRSLDCHEMKRMMYTAFMCVRSLPEERPSMDKVVRLLDAQVTCTEALLSR